MRKYKIADAHTHIFPPKIAEKAATAIGSFYGIDMHGKGVWQELIKSGDAIGVSKYLVCSTATKLEQVESINSFIADACKQDDRLVGFATMHPDYLNVEEELARARSLGLVGIKLHPDFQKFYIDDPAAYEIYRQAERWRMPVLFHTGDNRYDFSSPGRLAAVTRVFPDLICIAAHFGGYSQWEESYRDLGQPNVYYDTSSTLFSLPVDDAMRLIERFGDDKFMFGTDYPMWDHKEELERFMKLPLSEKQREDILYNNFERLLLK